jgi:hypothetical protein
VRSAPIVFPLTALLVSTLSALVLAAQSGLAFCNDRLAVPLPAGRMPGMDMSSMPAMPGMGSGPALTICPVVLVLIVASAVLAAVAIVVLWRDPHRTLAQRGIVRALASLPPARSAGVLTLLGGAALALMRAVDGAGAPGPAVCALLAALLAGCSLAAVLFSIAAGKLVLAFGHRFIVAIAGAIASASAPVARFARRAVPAVCGIRAGALLAAGRGLRAPPPVLR